jgi:hypothetical protein
MSRITEWAILIGYLLYVVCLALAIYHQVNGEYCRATYMLCFSIMMIVNIINVRMNDA